MMQTLFDWLSLIVFAALAMLFLQRSAEGESMGRMWLYLPPAGGCALANYLGNNDYTLPGALLLVASVAYIVLVLKPIAFK
jgi:hypothetical protein